MSTERIAVEIAPSIASEASGIVAAVAPSGGAAPGDAGVETKHAATRIRNITPTSTLMPLVSVLLMRSPTQCSAANASTMPTAVSLAYVAAGGHSTAMNVVAVIAAYATAAVVLAQSFQPTTNPTPRPNARRA